MRIFRTSMKSRIQRRNNGPPRRPPFLNSIKKMLFLLIPFFTVYIPRSTFWIPMKLMSIWISYWMSFLSSFLSVILHHPSISFLLWPFLLRIPSNLFPRPFFLPNNPWPEPSSKILFLKVQLLWRLHWILHLPQHRLLSILIWILLLLIFSILMRRCVPRPTILHGSWTFSLLLIPIHSFSWLLWSTWIQ